MCTFHLLNIAYRNRDFTAIFFLQLCECDGMWALSITILSTHTGRYCILRLISLSVYALEIPVMHRGLSNVNDGFCKLCLSACVHKATFKWISSPESAYKWNQFGKNAFGCIQPHKCYGFFPTPAQFLLNPFENYSIFIEHLQTLCVFVEWEKKKCHHMENCIVIKCTLHEMICLVIGREGEQKIECGEKCIPFLSLTVNANGRQCESDVDVAAPQWQ